MSMRLSTGKRLTPMCFKSKVFDTNVVKKGNKLMEKIQREFDGKMKDIIIYFSDSSRTENDKDMDTRAVSAVREAIKKAKVTKNPIAKYDNETKRPYLEYPDGKRVYG